MLFKMQSFVQCLSKTAPEKMWLLSQGSWVKATAPDEFVSEMCAEIEKMLKAYSK